VRRYAARRWLAPESEIVVRAPELAFLVGKSCWTPFGDLMFLFAAYG
jgi:hypothetical protein